jgi:uncharacterized RDD family membrane protein YckC
LVAGFVDSFVLPLLLTLPFVILGMEAGLEQGDPFPIDPLTASAVSAILLILYFGLLEGMGGAALGKRLIRLRVVSTDYSEAGLKAAFLRALIFSGVPFLPNLLLSENASHQAAVSVNVFSLILTAALFATARPKNGWRGIHEILSGTRVIRAPEYLKRISAPAYGERIQPSGHRGTLGPFRLTEKLKETESEILWLGDDPSLERSVWIREYKGAVPQKPIHVSPTRAGRLRWVDGRRTKEESWDAFEAVPGQSLSDLADRPTAETWLLMRQSLVDLTREFQAAFEEGEGLEISMSRIWLGTDGRTRLLEFPLCDGVREDLQVLEAGDLNAAQKVLHQVALKLLEGKSVPPAERSPAVHIPERLMSILEKLWTGQYDDLSSIVAELDAIEASSNIIGRTRRMLPLLTAWLPSLLLLIPWTILTVREVVFTARDPEAGQMIMYLSRIDSAERELGNEDERLGALKRHTAYRFKHRLEDLERLNPGTFLLQPAELELGKSLIESYGDLTPQEQRQAEQLAGDLIGPIENRASRVLIWTSLQLVSIFGLLVVAPVGLVGFVMGLFYPRGVLLRSYGISVIRSDGTRANRGRLTLRLAVVWAPALVGLMALLLHLRLPYWLRSEPWYLWSIFGVTVLAACCYLIGFLGSLYLPARGPQDRLAGTQLVRS